MGVYRNDREYSDRFLHTIRRLVGPHLIVPAPLEEDQKQATDLMVLRARDLTIACRVRRPGYAERFPYQFTVRSKRDSGAETELSKLVNGWGDWMFYGHAINDETTLVHPWWLIDLSAWRAALIRDRQPDLRGQGARLRMGVQSNGDGTHFTFFDLRSFPPKPPICVASAEPIERAA